MISRKCTKTIADAYYSLFTHSRRSSSGYNQIISSERLYDFLYVNEFEAWLLNGLKSISYLHPRRLLEFIMQIHTGESLVTATPQWTWAQRLALGQRVLKDLAECLIRYRLTDPEFETYGASHKNVIDLMQRTLELEGYIYRDNILWVPEETVIAEAEEQGVLESLMTSLGLSDIPTLKHHLELSATDYQESRSDDSISNSRKVLEGVLSQVAVRYSAISGNTGLSPQALSRPADVRDYLTSNGILGKKEKETISSIYGLLSETGGHPYIADLDQARLMRHLSLTISQFVLLRLDGFIRSKSK